MYRTFELAQAEVWKMPVLMVRASTARTRCFITCTAGTVWSRIERKRRFKVGAQSKVFARILQRVVALVKTIFEWLPEQGLSVFTVQQFVSYVASELAVPRSAPGRSSPGTGQIGGRLLMLGEYCTGKRTALNFNASSATSTYVDLTASSRTSLHRLSEVKWVRNFVRSSCSFFADFAILQTRARHSFVLKPRAAQAMGSDFSQPATALVRARVLYSAVQAGLRLGAKGFRNSFLPRQRRASQAESGSVSSDGNNQGQPTRFLRCLAN